MRIGIDVSQIVYQTGVSSYVRNLVKSLLEVDERNDYVLLAGTLRQTGKIRDFFKELKNRSFERKLVPLPPTLADLLWNRLHLLPVESVIGRVDVFHSSDWAQPPSSAFNVTTVHDLVPFKFPELSHPRIVSAHKARLRWIKKEVDQIIVPSEATKVDLSNSGINVVKINVIPEAPDTIFKPETRAKIESTKSKYGIKGKYLLAVGITPRKNTKRVIQAYESIGKENKMELVIIGYPYMKIEAKRGIILPGIIEQRDMPAIYSGAEALVYPSLYEGFGLPILEAFACKIPVVTSNRGSLEEVAKDAAELVDPDSVDSIKSGIENALENRNNMISKSVKIVKKFSWNRTAEKTLEVYKKAQYLNK